MTHKNLTRGKGQDSYFDELIEKAVSLRYSNRPESNRIYEEMRERQPNVPYVYSYYAKNLFRDELFTHAIEQYLYACILQIPFFYGMDEKAQEQIRMISFSMIRDCFTLLIENPSEQLLLTFSCMDTNNFRHIGHSVIGELRKQLNCHQQIIEANNKYYKELIGKGVHSGQFDLSNYEECIIFGAVGINVLLQKIEWANLCIDNKKLFNSYSEVKEAVPFDTSFQLKNVINAGFLR